VLQMQQAQPGAAGLGVSIDLRSGTFGICKQEQQDPKALSDVTDEKRLSLIQQSQ
jgi:hypothetical protein